MKNTPLNKRKINFPVIGFLMTFGGLLLVHLVNSLLFSGEYSILYSDCYHQYYPFFVAYRKALLSGQSLLYSWSVGMGMDYLGLISYYLASPFNLLSILLPEKWMLGYFSLLIPIKLGLASAFFALFLKKVFGKNDFSVSVFGCFYGLCAWALGYQWNIMWLDTFALLPLVVLGMVSLLENRRFLLYTLSLFLSIFSNYYIGLFTCIFTLLAFICYEICRWSGFKKFFVDLSLMALFSILAIGMTAILELPTLATLQATQSSANKFPVGFQLNIADENTWLGLLDAMRQVAGNMNGGLKPTYMSGLPNLYCGIIANILAFLFLVCKQVRVRDKLCSVFLLLFFNISFIISQLDYIWHGFHFTNMIPYRFSFLYSFVLLYMAFHAWTLRHTFRLWQIIIGGVLSFGIFLCNDLLSGFIDLITGKVVFLPWTFDNLLENFKIFISRYTYYTIYNVIFISLYLLLLFYSVRSNRMIDMHNATVPIRGGKIPLIRRTSVLLLCVILLELALNLVSFGASFPGTDVSDYPPNSIKTELAISYMKDLESDTLFYRAETTDQQTENDGALNGFNGISTFTSTADVRVTEFMRALGHFAKDTISCYCFDVSSPVTNLFLNLKYMIERNDNVNANPYFDDVKHFDSVHLWENNVYLPLGFLADSQIINVDFSKSGNRFLFQNELLQASTGLTDEVWTLLPGSNLTINSSKVTLTSSQTENGYCSYTSNSSNGTVTYSYVANRDGFMCVDLDLSKKDSYTIYLNKHPIDSGDYFLPQVLAVSDVKEGDVVDIELSCKKDEEGTMNISAAIVDEEVFRKGYDILNASTLELTEFNNTRVEGTIQCNRDGVLYTSIPQNGNWSATVDGQPVETVMIGGAMVGVPITEGDHTVSFTYHNAAFALGWKITLVCSLIFIGLCFFYYQPKFQMSLRKV